MNEEILQRIKDFEKASYFYDKIIKWMREERIDLEK
jgi:hypothetical protein